jgi:hypothetical protein
MPVLLECEELNMLPTLSKAQKILDKAWQKRLFEAKAHVFPHHLHPPVLPIVEGKSADFQREDRLVKPLKMKKRQITVRYKIHEGKGMTLRAFDEKAKEMGEGLGKQMWEALTGAINEAVAETGNEVKVKKGDFKQEDLLRMLEMRAHNFDQDGNPVGQMICGAEFGEEIKKRAAEWSRDKEFQAKADAIIGRKKQEFNEREACRRLVD